MMWFAVCWSAPQSKAGLMEKPNLNISYIPLAVLRRGAESPVLARLAMNPDHLLRSSTPYRGRDTNQNKIGKDLLSTTFPMRQKAHSMARMWSVELEPSTSRLRGFSSHHLGAAQNLTVHDRPGSNSKGYALSRVGCFNADLWRWGLSKSPACYCGADNAAESK